jgi:electron transfer flavoprotein beta subunit
LGQTGVVLAELLGMPHASIILQVEKTDTGLRVKRELEDGWFQYVDLPLPALLTIQSGGNRLRYATLMGIKRSKSKELKTVAISVNAGAAAIALERVYLPQKQKRTEMLTGTAAEVAAQIVEKLRFEVRVL